MMPDGWGLFLWPLMFIFPILAAMASRVPRTQSAPAPAPVEDPMVTLRDRFVRGEIGMYELEARPQGLLESDPHQSMPWWDNPIPPAAA